MTHTISEGGPGASQSGPSRPEERDDRSYDPVVGAGITLLGIFLMGTGGARDSHLVFDLGVLTAIVGAALFVLFVTLSAMKQRAAALSVDAGPTAPDALEDSAKTDAPAANEALASPPPSDRGEQPLS